MEKLCRASGLVNYEQQFKLNVDIGIYSTPNVVTFNELTEYVAQLYPQNMDIQGKKKYATLFTLRFNVSPCHTRRCLVWYKYKSKIE